MDKIEQKFNEKTSEVGFIELKQDASVNVNGYIIEGGTPLPIITDKLVDEIKNSNLVDEINLIQVIDGIIYLLGVDNEFKYIDKYKEILYAYDENVEEYIFYKGMKALEANDIIKSGIYFRAILELNPKHLNARLNYGLVLELISKDYFKKEEDKIATEFLNKATNEFETITEIDDKYSLSYYKLGYHYRYYEQFLKAKITWDKFLTLDKDEERLQEIRDQVNFLEDESNLEVALTYLAYNDYGKALDSLFRLMPKNKDNWYINYLIGLGYRGTEDYERSVEYLSYAAELNKEESDIYNELGISYFLQEKIGEAIKVFNEGIENIAADYKLYFNRGLGYIQLGDHERALKDINMAYELNPEDANVVNHKKELEDLLDIL